MFSENSTTTRQGGEPPSRGLDIDLKGIRHGFVHGKKVVRAVWDVDIAIPRSKFICIVGPSGCGKTTLLGMIAGMIIPRGGTVALDGAPIRRGTTDVAYMLARDALLPWRTAQQNVELGLIVRNIPKEQRYEISSEWLRRMGLSDFADSDVLRLSQGMRQRVAIARTLALNPRCVLMDEPFAALDAQTRLLIQKEFLSLWERERPTVVFVTHDLMEAILLGDRIILMSKRPGKIVADIPIDLPRPRDLDSPFSNDKFGEYYAHLAGRLREEVLAAEEEEESKGANRL